MWSQSDGERLSTNIRQKDVTPWWYSYSSSTSWQPRSCCFQLRNKIMSVSDSGEIWRSVSSHLRDDVSRLIETTITRLLLKEISRCWIQLHPESWSFYWPRGDSWLCFIFSFSLIISRITQKPSAGVNRRSRKNRFKWRSGEGSSSAGVNIS